MEFGTVCINLTQKTPQRMWIMTRAKACTTNGSGFGFGGFGFFGGSGFGRGFGEDGEVNPFENGALGGVALALVEANDTGVTAAALFLGGCNFVEEDFYGVFLM